MTQFFVYILLTHCSHSRSHTHTHSHSPTPALGEPEKERRKSNNSIASIGSKSSPRSTDSLQNSPVLDSPSSLSPKESRPPKQQSMARKLNRNSLILTEAPSVSFQEFSDSTFVLRDKAGIPHAGSSITTSQQKIPNERHPKSPDASLHSGQEPHVQRLLSTSSNSSDNTQSPQMTPGQFLAFAFKPQDKPTTTTDSPAPSPSPRTDINGAPGDSLADFSSQVSPPPLGFLSPSPLPSSSLPEKSSPKAASSFFSSSSAPKASSPRHRQTKKPIAPPSHISSAEGEGFSPGSPASAPSHIRQRSSSSSSTSHRPRPRPISSPSSPISSHNTLLKTTTQADTTLNTLTEQNDKVPPLPHLSTGPPGLPSRSSSGSSPKVLRRFSSPGPERRSTASSSDNISEPSEDEADKKHKKINIAIPNGNHDASQGSPTQLTSPLSPTAETPVRRKSKVVKPDSASKSQTLPKGLTLASLEKTEAEATRPRGKTLPARSVSSQELLAKSKASTPMLRRVNSNSQKNLKILARPTSPTSTGKPRLIVSPRPPSGSGPNHQRKASKN
eukprot:g2727.t1